eukprot:scaffold149962_cov31-Tisochrysis_lutea.AAC.1
MGVLRVTLAFVLLGAISGLKECAQRNEKLRALVDSLQLVDALNLVDQKTPPGCERLEVPYAGRLDVLRRSSGPLQVRLLDTEGAPRQLDALSPRVEHTVRGSLRQGFELDGLFDRRCTRARGRAEYLGTREIQA